MLWRSSLRPISLGSRPLFNLQSSFSTSAASSLRAAFERDGYVVVRGFSDKMECEKLMAQMHQLVDGWQADQLQVFSTDDDQIKAQGASSLFLDSADKIGFFLEKDAVDEETGLIKQGLSKHDSLNKVGHGLHEQDPVFKAYSTSPKVATLVRELGWQYPVLPQSMYIFKQALIGDRVTSHQDSQFLFTTPRQTCLGLWLALQDATRDNGCLWARPGSHKEAVRAHFKRVTGKSDNGGDVVMDFESLPRPEDEAEHSWDHAMPNFEGLSELESLDKAGFVAVPIEQGDLFVIHGQLDHLSLPNHTDQSRHTYQLHLIEGPKAGVEWHPGNWLQYPAGKPFMNL